ncbi:hypothetical protein MLAC_27820 [Mycobacterium lacus]|uniref:Uncharacterized protein n=1 Tax=Mycobacterium lacus TaxID=169765 RepID=A0A7I7NM69_9MYCO|nr:hypothetical protein MLAC_27820 [Mycobacterium lacus]
MLDGYQGQLSPANNARSMSACPRKGHPRPATGLIIHMGFVAERTGRANAKQAMAGLELIGRGRGDPGGG